MSYLIYYLISCLIPYLLHPISRNQLMLVAVVVAVVVGVVEVVVVVVVVVGVVEVVVVVVAVVVIVVGARRSWSGTCSSIGGV